MSEDIVTRLLEPGLCGWDAQKEAAAEIERLREELKESEEKVRVLVAAIQHSGELARENW